jgi:hypothetical protein
MHLPERIPRFNTEPSVELFQPDRRPQRQRIPRVIENELIKQSSQLHALRQNMLSEHRSRPEGNRHDLRSSGNTRVSIPARQFNNKHNSNCVELLTFYPKGNSLSQFGFENEFMDPQDPRLQS